MIISKLTGFAKIFVNMRIRDNKTHKSLIINTSIVLFMERLSNTLPFWAIRIAGIKMPDSNENTFFMVKYIYE